MDKQTAVGNSVSPADVAPSQAFFVEGVDTGEDIEIEATYSKAKQCATDKVQATAWKVKEVEWVGVEADDGETNLEKTSKNGGGDRIFPGSNTADGPTHFNVICRATLSSKIPKGKQVRVQFRIFDVDDPTQDPVAGGPPTNKVDRNDRRSRGGNILRVGGDNRPNGTLGMDPNAIETVRVSDSEIAEVEYTLTETNPGNNYKVLVSGSRNMIRRAEIDTSVANGQDSVNSFRSRANNSFKPPKENSSPLLSVWRKLHVEVDSMGEVNPSGLTNVDPLRGDVPDPDIGGVSVLFDTAYIHTLKASSGNNGNLPFEPHFQTRQQIKNYVNEERQTPSSDHFWSVHVVGIFEHSFRNRDNDPDSEQGVPGGFERDQNESEDGVWIAMEVLRDLAAEHNWNPDVQTNVEQIVVAHEIGHDFLGNDHSNASTDIMWAPRNNGQEVQIPNVPFQFSAKQLNDIRDLGEGENP